MNARVVIDRVLYELKSRESDCVKNHVIGSARIKYRQRLCTEVVERLKISFENGTSRLVSLQKDPAYLSSSIVEVVVGRQFLVLRKQLHRRRVAEVSFYISPRSEIVLFLAVPQGDTD